MNELSIIAAMSENKVIGKNGKLPWRLSEDLKRFKQLTLDKTVIMGRKTYESIGKPLGERLNIVITRQQGYVAPRCLVWNSLTDFLTRIPIKEEVMILGGSEIFAEAMPFVNKMYITEVHTKIEGEVCFPEFDLNEWKPTFRKWHKADDKNDYDYSFVDYTKR